LKRSGNRSKGVETVNTKITVIYDNPQDPEAFEAAYPEHLALAMKIPGIQKLETSKIWPKEDGSPTPACRLVDMYFTLIASSCSCRPGQ